MTWNNSHSQILHWILILEACKDLAATHDIKYNSKKSAIMLYRATSLKDANLPDFKLADEVITVVNRIKYLGHVTVSDLSDDSDIELYTRKLYC